MQDEPKLRKELQELLDENPNLEPTQLVDGAQVVTLTIVDGVPHLASSPVPDAFSYDLLDITEMHGTPIYRIYKILRELNIGDSETTVSTVATVQVNNELPEVSPEVKLSTPSKPNATAVVHSILSHNTNLKTKEDKFGMYRNLEGLQAQLKGFLKQTPELPAMIISTTSGSVEVAVVGGKASLTPTTRKGKPYGEVKSMPHARLLVLVRSIAGLENRLYGNAAVLEVTPPPVKISSEENLARFLTSVECGNLVVRIRSRKQDLYLSGLEKFIIYRGFRYDLEENQVVKTTAKSLPSGFVKIEYGALPQNAVSVLTAFWAYISPKQNNNE